MIYFFLYRLFLQDFIFNIITQRFLWPIFSLPPNSGYVNSCVAVHVRIDFLIFFQVLFFSFKSLKMYSYTRCVFPCVLVPAMASGVHWTQTLRHDDEVQPHGLQHVRQCLTRQAREACGGTLPRNCCKILRIGIQKYPFPYFIFSSTSKSYSKLWVIIPIFIQYIQAQISFFMSLLKRLHRG